MGAGLVGLATARALLMRGARGVCVIEAENRVAAHQSGHNSGVIHSGLYYAPGSLKARMCRAGRTALLAFCRERGVRHELCGKLVVAVDEKEQARLDELERRGRANGLTGLARLGPEQIAEREPHVRARDALLVPETGVVDFAEVTRALAADVAERGGELWLDCAAGAIRAEAGGVRVETPRGTIAARRLVNCGGLTADRVARRAGLRPSVRIVPFRGEYLRLVSGRSGLVRHLVYPVPDPALPFLGMHFTRTIAGTVEVGPNAVLALARHGYRRGDVVWRDVAEMLAFRGTWRLFQRHFASGLAELRRSRSPALVARELQRMVPELEPADLEPAGAGVRAQAVDANGRLVDDFAIVADGAVLHVLNAPSPAATAALAIGEYLAEIAR